MKKQKNFLKNLKDNSYKQIYYNNQIRNKDFSKKEIAKRFNSIHQIKNIFLITIILYFLIFGFIQLITNVLYLHYKFNYILILRNLFYGLTILLSLYTHSKIFQIEYTFYYKKLLFCTLIISLFLTSTLIIHEEYNNLFDIINIFINKKFWFFTYIIHIGITISSFREAHYEIFPNKYKI